MKSRESIFFIIGLISPHIKVFKNSIGGCQSNKKNSAGVVLWNYKEPCLDSPVKFFLVLDSDGNQLFPLV